MNTKLRRQIRCKSDIDVCSSYITYSYKILNKSVDPIVHDSNNNLNGMLITFSGDEDKPAEMNITQSFHHIKTPEIKINTKITHKLNKVSKTSSENIPSNIPPTKKFQNSEDKFLKWKNTKEDKIKKKRLEISNQELIHCTFKPIMNKNSQKIVKELNYPGIDKIVTECKPHITSKYIGIEIDSEKTIDILEKSALIYLNRTQNLIITEKETKIINQLINKNFN